jgi:transcriptional regulator with XRE-family HTH domain
MYNIRTHKKRRGNKMTIGEKIKKLREQKGLSLRQLAEEVGLTFSYLSQIEREGRNPSLKTLDKLCDFYDIDKTYFLADEKNWYKILPPELQEFVKKENIEYLQIGLKAKENGFTPEAINEIMKTVKKHCK